MNDMSSVIVAKSDQINADDLVSGPRTIRIAGVKINSASEQPVSIEIEGEKKVWRPCKTASRVLVAAWGPDANRYAGRIVTLYRDPNVKWGGLPVGGIRISAMSDIDPKKITDGKMTIALKESRNHSRPTIVRLIEGKAVSSGGDLLPGLKVAAGKGTAALQEAWQNIGTDARKALKGELAGLKSIAGAADDFDDSPASAAAEGSGEASAHTEDDAADALPARDDSQMGELVTLASALDEINTAETVIDVNNRMAGLLSALSEEEGDALRSRAMERIEALGGAR